MSTLPVIGSSIATATAGPMPGSTPTAVPRAQPMRHHSRLMGVIAAAKPAISALKISMSGLRSDPAGAGETRQADGQELGEQPEDRRRNRHAGHEVGDPGARRIDLGLT